MDSDYFALGDYRRRVADLYSMVRDGRLSLASRVENYRSARDGLFASHPVSALSDDQKRHFVGLDYYPHRPEYRLQADFVPEVESAVMSYDLESEGTVKMRRIGRVFFEVDSQTVSLSLFWILGYGGGLFLPFRDTTNTSETYGGGRYLLDTIKSADLGMERGALVLDFNFAYNPSCAYHARWQCPLAPQENWLSVAIPAGEKRYLNAVADLTSAE